MKRLCLFKKYFYDFIENIETNFTQNLSYLIREIQFN